MDQSKIVLLFLVLFYSKTGKKKEKRKNNKLGEEKSEELDEYAKKVLGKKIFDRERAKFRARAEQKARKNQVK